MKILKPVFTYILLAFFITNNLAQESDVEGNLPSAIQELNLTLGKFKSKKITAEKYLITVDSLMAQFSSEGISFPHQQCLDLLEPFRGITWSNSEFEEYKKDYFVNLMFNAQRAGRGGETMFYATKAGQWDTLFPGPKSLLEVYTTADFYNEHKNFNKIIDDYETNKGFFSSLPSKIRKSLVDDRSIIVDGILYLSIVANAYENLKDTLNEQRILAISDRIGKTAISMLRSHEDDKHFVETVINEMHFYYALYTGNRKKMKVCIDKERELLDSFQGSKSESNYTEDVLTGILVEYHLALGNNDSASYYLQKAKQLPVYQNQTEYQNEFSQARISANRGNFSEAYKTMVNALEKQEKAHAQLLTDLDDILYAYTESEFNKRELGRVQQEKEERNFWLLIISIFSVTIIGVIYYFMQREKRKSKAQIKTLNDSANFQIAMMEENKNKEIKEQRESLGQELHDGLTSSVAAILQRLELSLQKTKEKNLQQELSEIQVLAGEVYNSVRRKSHLWVDEAQNNYLRSFNDRIQKIVDDALPDSKYIKEVEIDPDTITRIDFNTRLGIIRIIQEALTNIIKHAKADVVNIFLYRQNDTITLSISDNGRGFNKVNKKGLGVQSMQQRATKINGSFTIKSAREGTEISVTVPAGKISQSPLV